MMRFGTPAKRLKNALTDFLFPPACHFCSAELPTSARDAGLCPDCVQNLAPDVLAHCELCGVPLGAYSLQKSGCVHCANDQFHFERAIAVALFKDQMQQACLRGKSESGRPLMGALARRLLCRIRSSWSDEQFDWVVAVPSHWRRRLRRDTSSQETIAEVLSGGLGVPAGHTLLSKVRATDPQRTLPVTRRRTNLKNAFRVNRGCHSLIAETSILLVDDVLTTGTTANECAKVLKSSGANRVCVAVVARGTGMS